MIGEVLKPIPKSFILYFTSFLGFLYKPKYEFRRFKRSSSLERPVVFFIINVTIYYLIVSITYKYLSKSKDFSVTDSLIFIPIELIVTTTVLSGFLHLFSKLVKGEGSYKDSVSLVLISSIIAPYNSVLFLIISTLEYKMGYSFSFFTIENEGVLISVIFIKFIILIYFLYIFSVGIYIYHEISFKRVYIVISSLFLTFLLLGYIAGKIFKSIGFI